MEQFKDINELVFSLNKNKKVIKYLFDYRKNHNVKQSDLLDFVENDYGQLDYLIDHEVIIKQNEFVELNDIYVSFFENVLVENTEINVEYIKDYIQNLNDNIKWYLEETSVNNRNKYFNEVVSLLKKIGTNTIRNVSELKRVMDQTYKNEANYKIKISKLKKLDQKRSDIQMLIDSTNAIIDSEKVFFNKAGNVFLSGIIIDLKFSFSRASKQIIDIQSQIINYLNLVEAQNRIIEKVNKLKYLKDQYMLEANTNFEYVLDSKKDMFFLPASKTSYKVSLNYLRTDTQALEIIEKVAKKIKAVKNEDHTDDEPITDDFLNPENQIKKTVDFRELYNAFSNSSDNLYDFVLNYNYRFDTNREQKINIFCIMASYFNDKLQFTETIKTDNEIEYPIIYHK